MIIMHGNLRKYNLKKKVKVKKNNRNNRFAICFSIAGDIKFWDLRTFESTKTINVGSGLTTFEAHPYADVLAW